MNITLGKESGFHIVNHTWKIAAEVSPAAAHGYMVVVYALGDNGKQIPETVKIHEAKDTLREAIEIAMTIVGL